VLVAISISTASIRPLPLANPSGRGSGWSRLHSTNPVRTTAAAMAARSTHVLLFLISLHQPAHNRRASLSRKGTRPGIVSHSTGGAQAIGLYRKYDRLRGLKLTRKSCRYATQPAACRYRRRDRGPGRSHEAIRTRGPHDEKFRQNAARPQLACRSFVPHPVTWKESRNRGLFPVDLEWERSCATCWSKWPAPAMKCCLQRVRERTPPGKSSTMPSGSCSDAARGHRWIPSSRHWPPRSLIQKPRRVRRWRSCGRRWTRHAEKGLRRSTPPADAERWGRWTKSVGNRPATCRSTNATTESVRRS